MGGGHCVCIRLNVHQELELQKLVGESLQGGHLSICPILLQYLAVESGTWASGRKISAEVALMGKMSRGRRRKPPGERASSKWHQAAFGSLRAASEKFGQLTWGKVTGSSRGFRVWSMGGYPRPPCPSRRDLSAGWQTVTSRKPESAHPVRRGLSVLLGAPSQIGCLSRSRSSLREGNWDHWFPGDGIEVGEGGHTRPRCCCLCFCARLLRLWTGVHTFELSD